MFLVPKEGHCCQVGGWGLLVNKSRLEGVLNENMKSKF